MWRKDPLLVVILCWTALVAGILVWLPLVRGATQGAAYQWVLAPGSAVEESVVPIGR